MAKVKTSEIDDTLAVALQQTEEAAKLARETNETIAQFKQEMGDFAKNLLGQYKSEAERLDASLGARIAVYDKAVERAKQEIREGQRAVEGIAATATGRLERAVKEKLTMSKAWLWVASLSVLAMVGILAFFEVSRRIDERTIQQANVRTQQANYLINNIKQWAKENPNDSRSLFRWADKQGIKL